MEPVDVVVVGGGIAGLVAAREVVAAGRSALVLEARDRVGGRTMGHTLGNGAVVEMGGQWVGPQQTEVLALVDELGLATVATYDEGDHLTIRDGTTTRYADETFGLPEASLPEVERLQEELEALAATVSLASPWLTPEAAALDRQTLHAWLTASTRDEVTLGFYRCLTGAVFTAEPWELSLLHFLFYVRSNGMLDNLAATGGGNQEARIVGGSHLISERLAGELGRDVVRLSTPVHAIRHGRGRVVVVHGDGEVVADRAVVALPPALAGRLRYDPPLPSARDALTQQMPMGSVIKVQAVYPAPFWRDEGLSGQALSFEGPVGLTYDNSPPDGSCGVLLGFLEGGHARVAARQAPEERRKLVLDQLGAWFGTQAADPAEYVEQDWMAEPYTRGCYSGRLGAGVWTSYGPALAEPVGRIHWAGTETADVSNGYMDGAVRSGRRAAREVLDALEPVRTR